MQLEVTPGQVLAGKYRVESVLGAGGMGVVVLAYHLQLDMRVAIKFMTRAALQNPEAVARFSREARAVVKIKSEHVARVSDVGTLETGEPYMVMEYLEGGDLSAWLRQHGRLSVEQAIDFILQASEAIAEAHSLGIVHRDLKPANLFVLRRPDGALAVKVLDFGISKVSGVRGESPDFSMTKTSAVLGSPLYMSPEQMRAVKEADARADIWALGVILYELLTGVTPFMADDLPQLVLKIAHEAPEPLRARVPDVPPALEAAIMRCLEKDPAKRFSTIAELAGALATFAPRRSKISIERIAGVLQAAGLSTSALGVPPSSGQGVAAESATGSAWGQTTPSTPGSRRALFGVGALLGVAVLATGAVYLLSKPTAVLREAAVPSTGAASSPPPAPAELASAPTTAPAPSVALPSAAPSESTATPAQAPGAPIRRSERAPAVSKGPARPAASSPAASVPPSTAAATKTTTVFDDRK